ncbi:MAG: hypothetical protein RIQ70_202, partial [Bacteroidota bacterium]
GFVITSICFLLLIADAIFNRKHNKEMYDLYRVAGYPRGAAYMNRKMLFIIVVWVASGIYLWG